MAVALIIIKNGYPPPCCSRKWLIAIGVYNPRGSRLYMGGPSLVLVRSYVSYAATWAENGAGVLISPEVQVIPVPERANYDAEGVANSAHVHH